ncbi:MAG: UDP-N-acetylmuramate--L-alanine ligase [Chloroflexi bacterium]|nr:UDP-N-acetylmuramate--L-alanine ligase [Chloroflexota bacterium]
MVQLVPGQHIHLVGIGGFGLSAIARVLLQQGYTISGSDRSKNELTAALVKEGATIYEGHAAANVQGAEMLVISSAVPPDHVEVLAAKRLGIPVYKRSDIIGALLSGYSGIAVAGTHGKTTTTAMVTQVLLAAGHDPSYIIGGVLRSSGHNAHVGSGQAFVIEADEYDYMFLGLQPQIAVLNNVEYDHPDFFKTPAAMTDAFRRFTERVPADGLLIACADNALAKQLAQEASARTLVTLYGSDDQDSLWSAGNFHITEDGQSAFDVVRAGKLLGTVRLQLPGKHNALNALAALVVADSQGIAFEQAAQALAAYQGTGRRFELRGELETPQGHIAVIDDYAHHPTAIKATLEAARARYAGRALWAVWQPHTYTRTQALLNEYATAFASADYVLVTDIYAAREAPIPGVNSAEVVIAMQHERVGYTPRLEDAIVALDKSVKAPAVVVVMSAGDAPHISAEFLARRRARSGQ